MSAIVPNGFGIVQAKISFRTVCHMVMICPQVQTPVPGVITAVGIGDLSQEWAGVRSQGMKENGKAEENETLENRISLKRLDSNGAARDNLLVVRRHPQQSVDPLARSRINPWQNKGTIVNQGSENQEL